MDEKVTIAVIAGTTREGRESIKAARYVAEVGRTLPNVEIIFVDPLEFNFPHDGRDLDEKDPKYSEITAKADAFFIVSPEYNHSFPGTLKRMLDSELDNYFRKPVALAGVSNGNWGGVRMVEALTTAVRGMKMVATYFNVYFPLAPQLFNAEDKIDPTKEEMFTKNIKSAYGELIWFAKTLKWGLANVKEV